MLGYIHVANYTDQSLYYTSSTLPDFDPLIDRVVDLQGHDLPLLQTLERKATSWNDSAKIILNNTGVFCQAGSGKSPVRGFESLPLRQ